MKIPELETNILKNIPNLCIIKEVKENKSYHIFANDNCARMAGFKNGDAMIGMTDEDIKCDEVVKNCELFYREDREVMTGKTIRTLNIYPYLEPNIIGLLGTKKPLRDNNGNIYGVIGSGISLKKTDINSFLYNIFKLTDLPKKYRNCFGSTYEIREEVERFNLSKQELRCLFYLIRGNSAHQISIILSRSVRTIENHIQNIKSKLNITKKSELFDFAFTYGLLNIIPNELIFGTATLGSPSDNSID